MNVRPRQVRLPIWIGTRGERRGLAIVARHADGWNTANVSAEVFAHKREVLDRHCTEAGRDPSEIKSSINVVFMLGADTDSVPEQWRSSAIAGTLDEARKRIQAFVDSGADQINFHLGGIERRLAGSATETGNYPWDLNGLERLASALELPSD